MIHFGDLEFLQNFQEGAEVYSLKQKKLSFPVSNWGTIISEVYKQWLK